MPPSIPHHLLLYSSSTANLGLFNGKMGISLFFFHYSRFTGKKYLDDFAGSLLDEIYDEIDLNCPWNMEDGLAGIAWGMEYLIRHRFVSGDTDEMLEKPDHRIVGQDVRRITDTSVEKGLKGLAYYVIARYASKSAISPVIGLPYVSELCTSLRRNAGEDTEAHTLMRQLKHVLNGEALTIDPDTLLHDILPMDTNPENKLLGNDLPLGIRNGYAGIGLQLLRQQQAL